MTSIPTSFSRRRIVWVATSPTCATNLSLSPLVCLQLPQGHMLSSMKRRSAWNARCMATAASVTVARAAAPSSPPASRETKAASPSISISLKPCAAPTILSSIRLVAASACPRTLRWNCMYSV